MARSSKEYGIALIVLVLGPAAVVGVFYIVMNLTAVPPHQNANDVRSVLLRPPAAQWSAAAEHGRQLVRSNVVEQQLPGVSIAVGVKGEVVWAEGFGWADLLARAPVTPDTRFRIGHVSVPLTSAAVGLLIEHGRVHLDHDIQEYLPSFPKKAWPVTLRQLMGHTAGIRHYKDTEWGDKPSTHCDRADQGLTTFASEPLLFAPDTKYQYSTYGWVVVSAAIEHVTEVAFADYMRTNVFEPLGMSATTTDAPRDAMRDRATPYFRNNFGREETTAADYSCFAGGGAVLSTPSDLVRFGTAMMTGSLLKPDTVQKLQTRQMLASGKETDYGLGWTLETIDLGGTSTRIAGHASRTIEGASVSFLTFPDRGLVVAVTANMSFADLRSIALAVAHLFSA